MVRTGGFRYGDLTVLYGDGVGAVVTIDDDLPVNAQVQGMQQVAVTDDLSVGGCFSGEQQGNTQTTADKKQNSKQNDPGSCFHGGDLARVKYTGRILGKYNKFVRKTQEKV